MKNPFASTPHRVSHTISSSRSLKDIPRTTDRRPSPNKPLPLKGRCASCAGRAPHKF